MESIFGKFTIIFSILKLILGKQSKVKGRSEYVTGVEKFLQKIYPGYADESTEFFNQFVSDLLAFLESELQAISRSTF
jgi:hypothetical protein